MYIETFSLDEEELALRTATAEHIASLERISRTFKRRVYDLDRLSEACIAKPTQKLAMRIFADTRDILGDVWNCWLNRHDQIGSLLPELVSSLTKARDATKAFVSLFDKDNVKLNVYGQQLLSNIEWRLKMATILASDSPAIKREEDINILLEDVARRK